MVTPVVRTPLLTKEGLGVVMRKVIKIWQLSTSCQIWRWL